MDEQPGRLVGHENRLVLVDDRGPRGELRLDDVRESRSGPRPRERPSGRGGAGGARRPRRGTGWPTGSGRGRASGSSPGGTGRGARSDKSLKRRRYWRFASTWPGRPSIAPVDRAAAAPVPDGWRTTGETGGARSRPRPAPHPGTLKTVPNYRFEPLTSRDPVPKFATRWTKIEPTGGNAAATQSCEVTGESPVATAPPPPTPPRPAPPERAPLLPRTPPIASTGSWSWTTSPPFCRS